MKNYLSFVIHANDTYSNKLIVYYSYKFASCKNSNFKMPKSAKLEGIGCINLELSSEDIELLNFKIQILNRT